MLMPILLALALCSLLIVLNSYISKSPESDREKPSPFECGFDPKTSARVPFSLRFYLVALIFLIFDVEITLIMPIPILTMQMNMTIMSYLTIFFVFILIAGLMHEWNQGALEWDN